MRIARHGACWRGALLGSVAALALSAGAHAQSSSSGSDSSNDSGGVFGGQGSAALPAPSGSLLPPTGFDPLAPGLGTRVNDFFGFNDQHLPTATSAGPGWQFKPQITVSEEFADNVNAVGGIPVGPVSTGSDFITNIEPQLQVVNTSSRVNVNLTYAPSVQIFAQHGDYTQVRQQGNGDVFTNIIPNLFFLDLRGSISQQPIFGGLGDVGTQTLPPQQQETLSSVSISPYFGHTFGSFGSVQAGVGYVYTDNKAPDEFNSSAQVPLALGQAYGSYWLATKRVFANASTGEDFGRFQNVLSTDSNFYDGSTALRSAQRVLVTDDFSYAVNRFFSVLGEIGYENLSYPNEGFAYVGGVWAAGVRLTPNADSSISLEYRRIDGIDAPYIYGSWQALPRLRIFGSYSEGITTFEEDQQNTLLSGNSTATGVAASALFAAPVYNNTNLYGGNQGLTQSRRVSASAAYTLPRDTISLSFNLQRSSQIGNAQGLPDSVLAQYGLNSAALTYFLEHGIPYYITGSTRSFLEQVLAYEHLTSNSTNNLIGSLAWHHDLRPDLSTGLYLGYTHTLQAYASSIAQDYVVVSASVSYSFTKTLSGSATYAGHYNIGSTQSLGAYNQNNNTFTLSLTKTF